MVGMNRKKITFGQIIIILILGLVTLTMIIPLLNILARSLSSPEASRTMSGLSILPKDIDFINYKIIFNHPVLMTAFWNSIFITVVGTIINILMTTSAAYALTRPKLIFKRTIMVFLICMMLFEPGLVPEYLVVSKLGLMGSKGSIILVTAVNVYYLIIMMRYFEEIPVSIYEAAKLDGAGHLRVLFSIVFPLSKAGIATITMFYAVLRWNEYFKSSIYLTKAKDTVLQVVLRQFVVLGDTASVVGQQNLFNYNDIARVDYAALKGAAIVVAIIPVLLLYPFVLRYYAKDVMGGGVKE